MNIALFISPHSASCTQHFMDAARALSIDLEVIDITKCHIDVCVENSAIYYQGENITRKFDAIIPRIEPEVQFLGESIIEHFFLHGTYTLNTPRAMNYARNKLHSLQLLAQHNIPTPKSSFVDPMQDIDLEAVLGAIGTSSYVIKLVNGTDGTGVLLTDNKNTAMSTILTLKSLNTQVIVQEFIKEASGIDFRAFVVGGEVIAAMRRQAQEGEFRANIALGGEAEAVKLTENEKYLAIKSADALGLDIAGVDILRSNRGPLVLEVNASPGVHGISTAHDKNICEFIFDHIHHHASSHRSMQSLH